MPPPPPIRMLVTPYIPQPDHNSDDSNNLGVRHASTVEYALVDDDTSDHSYHSEDRAAEQVSDPAAANGLHRMEKNVDTRVQATENVHNVQTTGMNNAGVARPAADPSPVVAETTRSYKAPGAGSRLPLRPLPVSFANYQNTTGGYFLSNFAGLSVDGSDNSATDVPPQHQNASSRSVLGPITNNQTIKAAPHSGNADADDTTVKYETNHTAGANPYSFNPSLGATTFSPEAFMKSEESLNELRGFQQRLWEQHERQSGSAKERERAKASIQSFIKQQNSIASAQQPDRRFTSTLDSFSFSPENILSKELLAETRRLQDRFWMWNKDGCEDTVLKQNQRVAAESSIKKYIENEKKTETQKTEVRRAPKMFAFATPPGPLFSPERFLNKTSLAEARRIQDRLWKWNEEDGCEDTLLKKNKRVAAESSIQKYIENEKNTEARQAPRMFVFAAPPRSIFSQEPSIQKYIENEKKKEAQKTEAQKTEASPVPKMFAFGAPPRSIFTPERFVDKKSLAEVQGLQDRVWTWGKHAKHEDERIQQEQRVAGEDSIRGYIKNQNQAELASKDHGQGSGNSLVKKEPGDEE